MQQARNHMTFRIQITLTAFLNKISYRPGNTDYSTVKHSAVLNCLGGGK